MAVDAPCYTLSMKKNLALVASLIVSLGTLTMFVLTVIMLDGQPVPLPGDVVDRSWIELTGVTLLGLGGYLFMSVTLSRHTVSARPAPRHRRPRCR